MPIFEYLGPIDEVEITGYPPVKRGKTLDVSDATAGHDPADVVDADGNVIGRDLGSGLRAQTETWREVKATKAPAKSKES
jgi:hypothetical protein